MKKQLFAIVLLTLYYLAIGEGKFELKNPPANIYWVNFEKVLGLIR